MAGGKEKDDRFAAVRKDPRFARFPRKKMTVAIDDRFKGMIRTEALEQAFRAPIGTDRSARLQRSSTMRTSPFLRLRSPNEVPKSQSRRARAIRRCGSFTTWKVCATATLFTLWAACRSTPCFYLLPDMHSLIPCRNSEGQRARAPS